ncbi:MgtC/SapB family protein [Candidatus Woesearchaeota archaeon]|nr:MgtC/SapB family protein [Candidatus Woesearchaeota archaeon]
MIQLAIFKNLLLAIALGVLIGLEREYAKYHQRGHAFAGIRTFPLIALMGALAAMLGQSISPWILYISLFLLGIIIAIAYFLLGEQDRQHTGATSEIAAFLTFFVGMFAFYGELTFAVTLAIVITLILYARSVLHHFAEKITREEMRDTIIFVLLAFVVLPLLPNQWYGPFDFFNPYLLWLMIVLISGISFIGYALIRWFGERGIGLAGLLGGLVGSTALTMHFAQRSQKQKKIYRALALGVILATGVMFIRLLLEMLAVNRKFFGIMLIPLIILSLICAAYAYFFWKKHSSVDAEIELDSPLRLAPALEFGLLFLVVLALIKIAGIYFPKEGIYGLSFLSGLVNLDAITITLAQLSELAFTSQVAARSMLLAVMANLLVKICLVSWLGGKQFRKIVLGLMGILMIIGIGLIFWM